jgi:Pentapeptide repeats (8 copies)
LGLINRGVDDWNTWRLNNPKADIRFHGTNFSKRDLKGIDFRSADLYRSTFWKSKVDHSNFQNADLSSANLNSATLIGADLRGANLRFARFIGADVSGAILSDCHVYGCSVWDLKGEPAEQYNLVITPENEPAITVDNIQVAQFVYLLLNDASIRHVIDTITSKVVLILGRFTPERKTILDAIRDELRKTDYLPILFDFEKPSGKSTLETVSTLAHMARFVIADLTDAKSVLQELQAIAPTNPSVPVQPIILDSQREPGMFDFFRLLPWVLEPFSYVSKAALIGALNERVIGPAEAKTKEQRSR